MKHFIKLICIPLFWYNVTTIIAQSPANVEVFKLSDKFYRLKCSYGNTIPNTFMSVGNDGILLIDGGFPQTAEELKSVIENTGNGKVKFIINTHLHPDHIGANALFAKDDAIIIAHDNVRKRLTGFYGLLRNTAKESLPDITFSDSLTLYFNNEKIKLLYFPGHTDSDIVVHFTESKIVFMGDLLLTNGFPSVETNVGGDIKQYIKTFEKIINTFPDDTRFIAGHGDDYSHDEMKQYYNFIVSTTDAIRKGLQEGKDIAAMREENIMVEWNIKVEYGATADYWIGAVAGSLTHEIYKTDIAEPLLETLVKYDADKAIALYKELKKTKSQEFNFSEGDLNVLGYYLLGNIRITEAIQIFLFNVEEYPESFNVYDSLGEAFMENGEKELAIKNYKKSLELNPDNINAVGMLKRLNEN